MKKYFLLIISAIGLFSCLASAKETILSNSVFIYDSSTGNIIETINISETNKKIVLTPSFPGSNTAFFYLRATSHMPGFPTKPKNYDKCVVITFKNGILGQYRQDVNIINNEGAELPMAAQYGSEEIYYVIGTDGNLPNQSDIQSLVKFKEWLNDSKNSNIFKCKFSLEVSM